MKISIRISYPLLIIVIFFILPSIYLNAQSELTVEKELEVKTSNNYFYGQSVGDSKEKAKQEARDDLMQTISLDIQLQTKLNVQSDIIIKGINYGIRPRGNKFLVLAYIPKDSVNNQQPGPKLEVVQLKYTESNKTIAQSGATNSEVKEIEKGTKNQQPESNQTEQPSPDNNINSAFGKAKQTDENKQALRELNTENRTSNEAKLFAIVQKASLKEVGDELKQLKFKGILTYGQYSSETLYPDRCFLLIFNPKDGNIEAFLDKGGSIGRIDLFSNSKIDNFIQTFNNSNIIWIQVY